MQSPNKIIILLFTICLLGFTERDNGIIKLTNHQKQNVPFKVKNQKIEWVNNVINLAFLSTDNRLIQINNIPESMLKDTTFKNSRVQVVMIDNNNKTFTQNKRFLTSIEIKCDGAESGHNIAIAAQGKIFHQKQWYRFEIRTQNILPKEKNLGTYKKMITN